MEDPPRRPDSLSWLKDLPTKEAYIKSNLLYPATSDLKKGESCPICYDEWQAEDAIVYTKECRHLYHERCLLSWFDNPVQRNNNSCPLCRRALFQGPIDEDYLLDAEIDIEEWVDQAAPVITSQLPDELRKSPGRWLHILPTVTAYVRSHMEGGAWRVNDRILDFMIVTAMICQETPPLDVFVEMLKYRNDRYATQMRLSGLSSTDPDAFVERDYIAEYDVGTYTTMPGSVERAFMSPFREPMKPTSITVRTTTLNGVNISEQTYAYTGQELKIEDSGLFRGEHGFPRIQLLCYSIGSEESGSKHIMEVVQYGTETIIKALVEGDTLMLSLGGAAQWQENMAVVFNYPTEGKGIRSMVTAQPLALLQTMNWRTPSRYSEV